MESRLYMYPRCKKGIKSISGLIRHINIYKIPVTLSSCQPFTSVLILEYNITNHLNLLSDNFKEDISLGALNNNKKTMRLADTIGNDDENSGPADIDK